MPTYGGVEPTPYDESRKPVTLQEHMDDPDSKPVMVSISFPLWSGVSFVEIGQHFHSIAHALMDLADGPDRERTLQARERHALSLAPTVPGSPILPIIVDAQVVSEADRALLDDLIKAAVDTMSFDAQLSGASPDDFTTP